MTPLAGWDPEAAHLSTASSRHPNPIRSLNCIFMRTRRPGHWRPSGKCKTEELKGVPPGSPSMLESAEETSSLSCTSSGFSLSTFPNIGVRTSLWTACSNALLTRYCKCVLSKISPGKSFEEMGEALISYHKQKMAKTTQTAIVLRGTIPSVTHAKHRLRPHL